MKRLFYLILSISLLAKPALAQDEIRGLVQDANGTPLMGATVQIKGTNINSITDANGQFGIPAQKTLPFTLIIKFVSYKTQEIEIYELPDEPLEIILADDNLLEEIVVTSRRREEIAQNVPIPITVIGGALAQDAGAFNVNRLKEMVPSVQLYSSNPRNTGLSIRGLGTTFGLTNDGIDPGVGFYVDGVYYVRTAATTIDFIDVEQIEILRGPQGTLFGKNTVAGAFNITTLKPSFTSGATFELSYGNYGYIQAKATLTGPLGKKLAGRLSFGGTQRDGLLYNTATQKPVNDLNNLGLRGQLLYTPTDKIEIRIIGDATQQRPDGYAQVFVGEAPTLRAQYRQFNQIIADLGYEVPYTNPFDRKIDHDTPWRSGQDFGGMSLSADFEIGQGKLTSTTAWRYWNWDPSNDRDFTGLTGLALSQAPSRHDQFSQEVRWAGEFTKRLSGVFGVFAFGQELNTDPYHTEEAGKDQWRFSQNTTSTLWATPGLLDGYGIRTVSKLNTISGAIFGQIDWEITEKLSLLPGLRYNYDDKKVDFNRTTYGGLETDDPALLAIKNSVYSPQAFNAHVDETNWSGQLTLSYKATRQISTFITYSTGFKPVGINLGGLPSQNGQPIIELAVIKPEEARHMEFGLKTAPTSGSTLNLTAI
ncbi:MAG: TonB-dependent receptor [Cyclobacteriaceae bacterium]|nr:TonB-dependent receptor [Cyclobacteriaceae bacterium]